MHDLMPRLQSGYQKYHSIETALLLVMSDVYSATDERRVTLLPLFDLSAAFDCVDHDIYSYAVFDWRLESKARRWPGSRHSSVPEFREFITLDSYQNSANSSSVSK